MEWWYFGPVVLAIIMFLLVGTVFERRIETAWQQFMESRRIRIAAMIAQDDSSRQVDHVPAVPTNTATTTPTNNATPTPCDAHNSRTTCNAEPTPPAIDISALNLGTEVPISTVCGKSETTAAKTPSKKSLRSRKSSTIQSQQGVVVVKS